MRGIVLTACLLAVIATSGVLAKPRHAEEIETTPEPIPEDVVCRPGDTLLPHHDCTKYYICDNGVPKVQTCAATLYFNPRVTDCDYDFNVPECVGGTRPPVGTATSPNTPQPTNAPTDAPTQAPTDAPTQAPTDAPTQAPTDAPTQAPTDAPTQAPTDAPTQAPTDAPTQAPTDAPTNEPTNAPTDAPTTPAPSVCKEGGVYNLPVEGNCSAYIQCVNHVALPRVCAEGLLFDRTQAKCAPAEDVDCPPHCEDPDSVYNIPDHKDCSLYYICAFGEPALQSCADGTKFDYVELDCLLAENAKCYPGSSRAFNFQKKFWAK